MDESGGFPKEKWQGKQGSSQANHERAFAQEQGSLGKETIEFHRQVIFANKSTSTRLVIASFSFLSSIRLPDMATRNLSLSVI